MENKLNFATLDNFGNLTNEEKLVLTLKESLERYKIGDEVEKEFYGTLVGKIAHDLKVLGVYDKYFN